MMSLWEFLQMGGYGAYVWTAYSLAAFFFAAMLARLWRQKRRLLSAAKEDE